MANVILSLCICFFAAFGCASSTANALIDAVTSTLTFTLENDNLIDINLLFGVTIVAGKTYFEFNTLFGTFLTENLFYGKTFS